MQTTKETRLKIKPLQLGRGIDYSGQPVMAAEAWITGGAKLKKPRHEKRYDEKPPKDVSLKNIESIYPWIDVLQEEEVRTMAAVRSVASNPEVDVFVVTITSTDEAGAMLYELSKKGVPIIPMWDDWGYSWNGRFVAAWAKRIGFATFVPVGEEDIDIALRALRAIKRLNTTSILYIGDIPSHSVNSEFNPYQLYRQFGVEFRQIAMNEYVDAIKNVYLSEANNLAEKWNKTFNVMDGRMKYMDKYSSIYVALHQLLSRYDANALTIDCAYLPSVEYVPCVAASYLIDKGIAFGCEGDISQLIALQLFMGLSGESGLMGNLFENVLHKDIENGEIVINHDVLPPTMTSDASKICFRDFHNVRQGSTLIADMPKGPITMGGISFDFSTAWLSRGSVTWAEDTVHCRLSVGIAVENPQRIMKQAMGHHQIFTYGNYLEHAKLALDFLGTSRIIL